MKRIYQILFFLALLGLFQRCNLYHPSQENFLRLCDREVINMQIKKKNLNIDKSIPHQTISKGYDGLTIVYQVDTRKECIFAIQAFFKNLNTADKILDWVKQSKATIKNEALFNGQQPFTVIGQFGSTFECSRTPDGDLEVIAEYSRCK